MSAQAGRAVIGVIGNDVPRQLVLAAGALPVRITGSWEGAVDAEAVSLLGATDIVAARILHRLRHDDESIHALIICNDSQAHLRLFYAVRETMPALRVLLLDPPRRDSPAARAFTRHQYERVISFVQEVSTQEITPRSLHEAARAELALGAALERMRSHRRATPSRCTGTRALSLYRQAVQSSPAEAVQALTEATTDANESDAVADATIRVHLTGSAHPDESVYRLLEEGGLRIVSDDHDTGDGSWVGCAVDVSDTLDSRAALSTVLEGLIDAHFARVTTSATALSVDRAALTRDTAHGSAARVVGALVRDLDDAPRWDVADQAATLSEIDLALHVSRIPANPHAAAAGAHALVAAILANEVAA